MLAVARKASSMPALAALLAVAGPLTLAVHAATWFVAPTLSDEWWSASVRLASRHALLRFQNFHTKQTQRLPGLFGRARARVSFIFYFYKRSLT